MLRGANGEVGKARDKGGRGGTGETIEDSIGERRRA